MVPQVGFIVTHYGAADLSQNGLVLNIQVNVYVMYALFPSSKTSQTPTQKQGGMLWLCLFWDHVLQGP